MTCHKRTEHAGVGGVRTIAKYASERDGAAARVFLNGSSEVFGPFRQLLIINIATGNLDRTTTRKSAGGLKKPVPEQSVRRSSTH